MVNATDRVNLRSTFCLSPFLGDENAPSVSGEPAALQTTCMDDQRCWSCCVSPRLLIQVDTEHRGGWTQMLGSEASEPRDLLTDRKITFLPTLPSFEAPAHGESLRISRWNLPQKN